MQGIRRVSVAAAGAEAALDLKLIVCLTRNNAPNQLSKCIIFNAAAALMKEGESEEGFAEDDAGGETDEESEEEKGYDCQ